MFHHFLLFFASKLLSISAITFLKDSQFYMFKVIPFFVGNISPSFSKNYLRFTLTLPLNSPIETLLYFVKAQNISPSLLTCLAGLSESSSDCSSDSSSSSTFFLYFLSARASLFDINFYYK